MEIGPTTAQRGYTKNRGNRGGLDYELALATRLLVNAVERRLDFVLGVEVKEHLKFDDWYVKYYMQGAGSQTKETHVLYGQAKHVQDTSKAITFEELKSDSDSNYGLLMYFNSFRKLWRNDATAFIICTTRSLTLNRPGNHIRVEKILEDPGGILDFGEHYRLRMEDAGLKRQIFERTPLMKLAKVLAERVLMNDNINVEQSGMIILKQYQVPLGRDVIEDKKFKEAFISGRGLSKPAARFRRVFVERLMTVLKQEQAGRCASSQAQGDQLPKDGRPLDEILKWMNSDEGKSLAEEDAEKLGDAVLEKLGDVNLKIVGTFGTVNAKHKDIDKLSKSIFRGLDLDRDMEPIVKKLIGYVLIYEKGTQTLRFDEDFLELEDLPQDFADLRRDLRQKLEYLLKKPPPHSETNDALDRRTVPQDFADVPLPQDCADLRRDLRQQLEVPVPQNLPPEEISDDASPGRWTVDGLLRTWRGRISAQADKTAKPLALEPVSDCRWYFEEDGEAALDLGLVDEFLDKLRFVVTATATEMIEVLRRDLVKRHGRRRGANVHDALQNQVMDWMRLEEGQALVAEDNPYRSAKERICAPVRFDVQDPVSRDTGTGGGWTAPYNNGMTGLSSGLAVPTPNLHRDASIPAPKAKKEKGGRFMSKKKERTLTKADIGPPFGFRHVSHIGWNPDTGFDVENVNDKQMNEFFERAGVSDMHLEDHETRKFIYSFITEHGVVEAMKETRNAPQPMPPPPPPPPPPPSFDGPPVQKPNGVVSKPPAPDVTDNRSNLLREIREGRDVKPTPSSEVVAVADSDPRSKMLDDIRKGPQLRPVDQLPKPPPVVVDRLDGMAAALAKALEDRAKFIYSSDDTDEEDGGSTCGDDEWED